MKFKSESDMIPPLVNLLEDWGYEVFTDVCFGGKMPDVIGISDMRVNVAIEAKLSNIRQVFYQAMVLSAQIPYVYIAIPENLVEKALAFPETHLTRHIGIISVGLNNARIVKDADVFVNPHSSYGWIFHVSELYKENYEMMVEYKKLYGTAGGYSGRILGKRYADLNRAMKQRRKEQHVE